MEDPTKNDARNVSPRIIYSKRYPRNPAPPYLREFLKLIQSVYRANLLLFLVFRTLLDLSSGLVTGGTPSEPLRRPLPVSSRFLEMLIGRDKHITFNRNIHQIVCNGGRGRLRGLVSVNDEISDGDTLSPSPFTNYQEEKDTHGRTIVTTALGGHGERGG